MSFLKSSVKPSIAKRVANIIGICVDCGSDLHLEETCYTCSSCGRVYICDEEGVWDFRQKNDLQKPPEIFTEDEFQRWVRIFRQQESQNWVIYKNRFYRFISQSGHRILGKRLARRSTENSIILEVGAGTGSLLEFLPADNFVAVDTSIESLRVLKSRWPEATVICASGSALPFKPDSFDHVVSLHTLEHLYFLSEALQEMKRVMQSNGIMHYVIPTEGGLAFLLGRKLITGPHLRKKYGLDVQYVMDREHINDAPRVLKFLRMYFGKVERRYWPLPFIRILSLNAMIYGECHNNTKEDEA